MKVPVQPFPIGCLASLEFFKIIARRSGVEMREAETVRELTAVKAS